MVVDVLSPNLTKITKSSMKFRHQTLAIPPAPRYFFDAPVMDDLIKLKCRSPWPA
jgi:hypothetical protein